MEFGAFTPLMRSHGADAPREIYQFGKRRYRFTMQLKKFINIRYRLLPYIYSASWDVTAHQSSMMRALVMDFSADKNVWNMTGEYHVRQIYIGKPSNISHVHQRREGRDKVEDFSTVKSQETISGLPAHRGMISGPGEKLEGGKKHQGLRRLISSCYILSRVPLCLLVVRFSIHQRKTGITWR